MKILSVSDEAFSVYGRLLEGYDYTELFFFMERTEMPAEGMTYTASVSVLEQCAAAKELRDRGFGGLPIQIGFVNGKCRSLDCLEYHRNSEFNIAVDDTVLVLGRQQDIAENGYDLRKCQAFFVPAGTGVELYGTTLHYAPMAVALDGCRVICVLPAGTNGEKPNAAGKTGEDRFLAGCNKWLLAHPDSNEAVGGLFRRAERKENYFGRP